MFAARFASIASAIAIRYGGPFHAGLLHWPGEAVYDDGGSIITPGTPIEFPCMVQIDQVTEAMRQEAGYTDTDVRLIVLAPGLERAVDSDATVEVLPGVAVPALHVGSWLVAGETQDVLGCAYDGRGRKV
jgi:hypothetical protein